MKTKLFCTVDIEDADFGKEKFVKDLSFTLKKFDKNRSVVEICEPLYHERNVAGIEDLENKISSALGLEKFQLGHITQILSYFIRNFVPDGTAEFDLPEDLAEDMIALNLAVAADEDLLIGLIRAIRDSAHRLVAHVTNMRTLQKGEKVLEQASSSINFRVKFQDEKSFGEVVENYLPKCTGVLPIVTIQLTFGNKKDDVLFNVDEFKLKQLLTTIKDALIELDAAKGFLNLE